MSFVKMKLSAFTEYKSFTTHMIRLALCSNYCMDIINDNLDFDSVLHSI